MSLREKIHDRDNIFSFALILIQLLFSLRFMGRQYLSLDEVSQIGFIVKKNPWGSIFNYYTTSEVTNLPFFPMLAALWYRIVPYGEGWLRLLTVILTTMSLVAMVMAARKLGSKRTGAIMALFACISSFIMHKCGITFRCHALWLLFTSLTLCLYIARFREPKKGFTRSRLLLLGLSMALLVYCHYFGLLTVLYLAAADLILICLKKLKAYALLSYICAGACFLPWGLIVISKRTMDLGSFWPKTPTFASIPQALRRIFSNDEAVFVLWLIALIVIVLESIRALLRRQMDFSLGYLKLILALMPALFVIGDYFYSAHINTRAGIFVLRYFLSVVPAGLLIVSLYAEKAVELFSKGFKLDLELVTMSFFIFVLLYLGIPNFYEVKTEVTAPFDNTYGNVRDIIENDGHEYDESTLIMINANRANADGFEEYYLEYGGRSRDVNVVSNEDPDIGTKLEGANLVYIYQVMNGKPDIYTDMMGADFKEVSFDQDIGLYKYERIFR